MPLVEIQNLHKTYDHHGAKLDVLKGIDLTIDQGEVIADASEASIQEIKRSWNLP